MKKVCYTEAVFCEGSEKAMKKILALLTGIFCLAGCAGAQESSSQEQLLEQPQAQVSEESPIQNQAEVSFPADGAEEDGIPSFQVELTLPQGWEIGALEEPLPSLFNDYLLTPMGLYEGETLKAFIGFNQFERYEEEIPQEDFYKTVYPNLRLGSLYHWDDYTPLNSWEGGENALASVYYKLDPGDQSSAASWPETVVPGLLCYDLERQVYVGIQFQEDAVTEEQIRSIGESLRITAAENPS